MTNHTVQAGRDLWDRTHHRQPDNQQNDPKTAVAAGRQRHQDEHKAKHTNPPQKPAQE